jgi:anti-anti-sigma factor
MSVAERPAEQACTSVYRQRLVHVAPVPIELAWDLVDGELRVAIVGELCAYTTRLIGQTLDEIVSATSTRRGVIDLAGVTFFDARGISMLLNARRRARAAGVSLRIGASNDDVVRLLTSCGIDPTLAGDGDPASPDAAGRFTGD